MKLLKTALLSVLLILCAVKGSAHLGRLASDRINLALFPDSFTLTYNF